MDQPQCRGHSDGSPSPSESRTVPPIFVVGVPRSGTTLLSAMLGAHPRLVCGPETHFFTLLDARSTRLLVDWPRNAVDYLYSIRHVGDSIPANYGLDRTELTEALARKEPSLSSILSGMAELYMERNGGRRWVEKTPDHLSHVALIRREYPDSPIVRIVRDPRDVAASLMSVSWGPNSLLKAVDIWRDYDARSAGFFESDPRSYTVRCEDLLRDPEATLRGLCRAVGEEYDPAMLDTSRSARTVNATNEAWKAKVAEKPDPSRIEAWRQQLSEDQLRMIESCIGDRLRAYGYPVLGFDLPHYVGVHPLAALGDYAELADELVARRARFWGLPEERPELRLFLGDPRDWRLGGTRGARLAHTARLAWSIARHRLGGVPVAWFQAPGQAMAPGVCTRFLSWALPRPTARYHVPAFAHPADPP